MRRLAQPGPALLILSLLLPALVFGLAAWQNRRDLYKQAELRAHRTTRTLVEHAVKIFETHLLVIGQINERLRSVDWSNETDRAELHRMLADLQTAFEDIATITITDAEGRMRSSGRTYPADPSLTFADREWFQALKARPSKLPFISRSAVGRQSQKHVFNVAQRVRSRDGSFEGAIAISIDRAYFERFFLSVEPQPDNMVLLVRRDGQILAHAPPVDAQSLPQGSPFYSSFEQPPGGMFEAVSKLDNAPRLFSYRKVGEYPVYIGLGLSKERLLATWRHNLFVYAVLAAFAALALLAMSALVLRQMARERLAVHRWQTTAAELRAEAAERERVEAHLRQSQKMEAIGQLTSGIAHDFNNMLGAVIASLDLLRLRLKRQNAWNEAVQRHLDNAMEGAWRAASLTQRLLAFSRKQVLSPSRVDVNELVGGMSELIRRTISEDVTIELELAEGVWPTHADPNQLENAVLNLVVNARDAMEGGGCLKVETRNCASGDEMPLARPGSDVPRGDYIVLAVHDTGTGMSPEVLARAFDPFFTTKEIGKGTGLGLSQVQGFVAQSHGHVKVFSDIGRGTTVEIYLPALAEAGPISAEPAEGHPGGGGPEQHPAIAAPLAAEPQRTVLVVEDDPQVRRVSKEAFRELGFAVLEADGAKAALQILAHESDVTLLFTDVVMPEINGTELAQRVRQTRPEIKVLFTTGYAQGALAGEPPMDPAAELITKPFNLEELSAKVTQTLRSAAKF